MSYDRTFCSKKDCKHTECTLHQSNIRDILRNRSVADYENTEYCEMKLGKGVDMERLTTPWMDGTFDTFDPIDIVDNEYSKINYERVLNKLGAYEDLEEQGLLLRLPCKVGDTVYFIDRKYDRENRKFVSFVHNGYVKAFKFSARPTKATIEYEDVNDSHGRCKGHDIHASNIGKTVFLTKEEAEQKLAEMKGE